MPFKINNKFIRKSTGWDSKLWMNMPSSHFPLLSEKMISLTAPWCSTLCFLLLHDMTMYVTNSCDREWVAERKAVENWDLRLLFLPNCSSSEGNEKPNLKTKASLYLIFSFCSSSFSAFIDCECFARKNLHMKWFDRRFGGKSRNDFVSSDKNNQ